MTYFTGLSRQSWPTDPSGLDAYYGNPTGVGGPNSAWVSANLVPFSFPWKVSGGQGLIHVKVKPSLDRILAAIWDYVGHDQAKINQYHLNEFGGSFVYRQNVNNPSKLSNHARGIALDLAPSENPNGKSWVDGGNMLPRFVIEAFKEEGWRWGGDFSSTKDPMHFEAVYDQHHDQPPVPAPSADSTPAPTPVPTPIPAPSPTLPTWPFPIDDLLIPHLLRQWALHRTGIPDEVAKWKADIKAKLEAIEQEVDSFVLQDQGPTFPKLPIPFPIPLPLPQPAPAPVPTPAPAQKFTGITATVFGGSGDHETSAYDKHLISDTEPGCSLPYHFTGVRPQVCITGPNGHTVTVPILDVGPWNTDDPYWQTNSRPQAESGTDKTGRHTNQAGIDLTPATARALGVDGKGKVDWWFANQTLIGDTPMANQQTDAFLSWVAARLKEPSTYSSLAGIAAIAAGHALDPGLVQNIAIIGGGVAGVLGMFLSEGKA